MAKGTKGSGQGPKPPTNAAKTAAESLPAFDEKALLSLTEKIEKGFGKSKSPQHKPENRNQTQRKPNNSANSDPSKPKDKAKGLEPKQGNKRDARGNRKQLNEESKKGVRSKRPQNENTKDEKDILLQEILALGGTEEDLQLVADAISDDEDLDAASSAPPDKSFRADLAKFVAGLGIDAKLDEDAHDSESGQENDDEWETSGEEALDKPVSSAKAQQTNGASAKSNLENNSPEPSSKDSGRLVGTSSLRVID
jgi:ribosome biogenesis protein MAK21